MRGRGGAARRRGGRLQEAPRLLPADRRDRVPEQGGPRRAHRRQLRPPARPGPAHQMIRPLVPALPVCLLVVIVYDVM